MVNMGLGILADCIKSLFFGEVCDTCDGKAIYSLLAGLIRLFTIGVGILAVIGIMVTGVMYLTSSGDPAKHNKAKSRFVNIILGLAVYVCLFVIAEFLMPGGVVNHPISSTEETSCPETTYTDTSIRRPENPGSASGTSPVNPDYKGPSPYAGTKPTLSSNTATYNGTDYNYLEIKNATPFAYAPTNRENFVDVLKTIESKKEGDNILVIANAGTFITSGSNKYDPTGLTIENGEIKNSTILSEPWRVFVVDESGGIGFLSEKYSAEDLVSGKASYVDGLTGATVSGKKIISAIHEFGPLVVNGQGVDKNSYKASSHYDVRRERQIFCVKSDKTNVIISNSKNYDAGGWNFDHMVAVSLERGCQFAFNFDGGGSTATAWRDSTNGTFENIYRAGNRIIPSFIVFTDNNLPPGKTEADYQSSTGDETPTKSFDAKTELMTKGDLEYWLNVPQGAKDKMPLIIFLHGSGEKNSPNDVKKWKAVDVMFKRTDFISIAPVLNRSEWRDVASTLKSIIDDVVSTYGINKQRIHIFGFSLGGIGTWYMVNKNPLLFASAVPISGKHLSALQTNFLNTKIRAIVGGSEGAELRNDMKSFVTAISSIGGSATFETVPGKRHDAMQSSVNWNDVINWMLSQKNLKAPAPQGSSDSGSSSGGGSSSGSGRNYLKGTAPIITKQSGTYEKGSRQQSYSYINISNAIPYIYYDKSGNFGSVVSRIQQKTSNILVVANSYVNVGPAISGGKIVIDKDWNENKHQTFVVDENGNVGYALNHTSSQDLISGNFTFYDILTDKTSTGHKVYSATTGWGMFYKNGKENFSFDKPIPSRQRTILCFKSGGKYTLFTMSKDENSGKDWGWSGNDMVEIVKKHGCDSAYNFDGGKSTELAWRNTTKNSFSRDSSGGGRGLGAYLVFTSDNNPPYAYSGNPNMLTK